MGWNFLNNYGFQWVVIKCSAIHIWIKNYLWPDKTCHWYESYLHIIVIMLALGIGTKRKEDNTSKAHSTLPGRE